MTPNRECQMMTRWRGLEGQGLAGCIGGSCWGEGRWIRAAGAKNKEGGVRGAQSKKYISQTWAAGVVVCLSSQIPVVWLFAWVASVRLCRRWLVSFGGGLGGICLGMGGG